MGYERYTRGNDDGFRRDRDERDYGYRAARDYGAGQDRDYGRQRDYGYGSGGYPGDTGFGRQGYAATGPDRGYLTAGDYYRDRDHSAGRDWQGRDNRDDRGFFDRAGDKVRSWFGDEEAERRRERDARESDSHYSSWRRDQISALDRDYDEYRRENRQKFDSEFSSWRTERQGQRTLLGQVSEHQDVVGSDGSHVGTVDKVRGDRIILTKGDAEAGGRHLSIPSRWIDKVEGGTVTLRKTAEEAQSHWRDEERNGALFGENRDEFRGDRNLNRSFSGTY